MDRISDFSRKLSHALGTLPDQINHAIPVVIRKRCFTPTSLVQTFLLALMQKPTAGDADIAIVAATLGVAVTPQAIDQRYTPKLAKFLQQLFTQLAATKLRANSSLCKLMERFTEVIAIDSSVVTLPDSMAENFPGCGGGGPAGGNAAALKLQTELDLKNGALLCVQIEPGRSPDGASDRQAAPIKAGSLRLADLGYFSLAVLARIVAGNAHFISRIQSQTRLIIEGKAVQAFEFLARLSNDCSLVDRMIVLGQNQQLKCRLIAWRVPPAVAEKRRRTLYKNAKKRGTTPSQSTLAACDWNILVTDLSGEELTVKEAIVLYRSRWQIELLFKRWKSYCGIDLLDGHTPVHVQCRLWMRLCVALIQQQFIAVCCWVCEDNFSFAKVSQRLQQQIMRIASVLHRPARLSEMISVIANELKATCRRSKRRKSPNWFELIRNPEMLEYSLTWR